MLTKGAAAASLSYSFNLGIIHANYETTAPDYQPDIMGSAPITIQHKVYAVDFNPNEVRAQYHIRQGWY